MHSQVSEAKAVSSLFGTVETGVFDLILFFFGGCGKSGEGVGGQRRARLGPGPGFGILRRGCEGDGGVFEGGIEGCFHAHGGGGLDGFDHEGFSEGV